MSDSASEARSGEGVWNMIRREERYDRFLRLAATLAWILTLGLLVTWGVMVASEVSQLQRLVEIGVAQQRDVFRATIPLIAAAGTVTLILAVLATIGIFIRMRAATLGEIQLRLAALEAMIAARPDVES